MLVDADEYLKHLSRYIHLNPVRAKMVESASDYPWSSHLFFIGKRKMPGWLAGDRLLSQFGKNLREAKKKNLAREVAIYLSRNFTGHSGKELGEYFGGISGAAITMRHKAVADQMETDRKLKALMKRLEKQIINI